jgi:hypothetical protein
MDRGIRNGCEDLPASIVRLAAAGLIEHDGCFWSATALGRETVRANASCRDGSEGFNRPPAYWRARHEDADNPE